MIPGGYYIKARKIQDSEISTAPPHVREIWDWLLKEVNHAEVKKNGKAIERGQCVRSYKDIQEGLKWFVGYRKMVYKTHQIETAMKWLTKRNMVTTTKTTRGMLITVCNYDTYQDPSNYENHTVSHNKTTIKPQSNHTINKNGNNEKNDKKKEERNITDKKSVSDHKLIIDKWHIWYLENNHIKPEINGSEAQSVKRIITYFKKIIEDEKKDGTPSQLFEAILDRWDVQDKWIRENVDSLKKFYSQINSIVKNAKKTVTKTEQFKARDYSGFDNF